MVLCVFSESLRVTDLLIVTQSSTEKTWISAEKFQISLAGCWMFAVFFTPSPPFARFDERSEASQKVGTEGGFLKGFWILDD